MRTLFVDHFGLRFSSREMARARSAPLAQRRAEGSRSSRRSRSARFFRRLSDAGYETGAEPIRTCSCTRRAAMRSSVPMILLVVGSSFQILAPDFVIRANSVRSEEHTSELQSLMRLSYAVFCLKKTQYKQK